ncbi:VanW family protein, partial [Priestia flexa]|uniref:VanW family protein n=2 Tax=Priestia flexa TaxID=86664 RepID=UPI002E1C2D68|nr:VanW family protein [Priestia flexa]
LYGVSPKKEKKEPVIKVEDLTYQLKDSRTGALMREFKPVNFADKEVYNKEIKALASELAKGIDTPMQSMKLDGNGALIGGSNRIVLKEDELVASLQNLNTNQLEITVPIYETPPNVSVQAATGVSEVPIASFTTKFRPNDTGRNRNIQLSAEAINNTILGPGDYFSYNSVVGPRTVERGYQQAPEIINKELVMGIGGGICQTSSTLFNAVDKAGVQIVARSHHSKDVGYVPKGRDATVSWNGPDFKFMNNKSYPIIIKTYTNVAGGTLTVEVRTAQRYL